MAAIDKEDMRGAEILKEGELILDTMLTAVKKCTSAAAARSNFSRHFRNKKPPTGMAGGFSALEH